MAINFVPNDPLALAQLPVRRVTPRPNPPAHRASFQFDGAVPEGLYATGTKEFLHWQCREAALATLDLWNTLGTPLTGWQGGNRLLPIRPVAGPGFGGHYDRKNVAFLESTSAPATIQTAASAEAVAHEIGHAILDTLRQDLWGSVYSEAAAFHEAFADCIALLVNLSDQKSRQYVLQPAVGLRSANVLEAIAEEVAAGLRASDGPQHPGAAPRRALNTLKWAIPINLPIGGPPSILSREPHSFSRVFTGCFYDMICNMYATQPQTSQGLLTAATIAGRLLVAGARSAPQAARFYRAVGRAMILADSSMNASGHHTAIRDAFAAHNVALGSAAMLAPSAGLPGHAPKVRAISRTAKLAPSTRRALRGRLRLPSGARLRVSAHRFGAEWITHAAHSREVSLRSLDKRFGDAVATALETTLLGESASGAAILGEAADPDCTIDEAQRFVEALLHRNCIDFGIRRARRSDSAHVIPTHAIRIQGGRKVLARIRFSCCQV